MAVFCRIIITMKLEFKGRCNQNITTLMRGIGYAVPKRIDPRKRSFIRRVGRSDYPHFHLYIDVLTDDKTIMDLHLDQKQPSYSGSAAHAGEYSGPVVDQEAQYIKGQLTSCFK